MMSRQGVPVFLRAENVLCRGDGQACRQVQVRATDRRQTWRLFIAFRINPGIKQLSVDYEELYSRDNDNNNNFI